MQTSTIIYLVRRAINAVITLLLLIFLIFVLVHTIAPTPLALARIYCGNPHCPPAELQAIIQQYQLNLPIPVQFAHYVDNVFHGNFGMDTLYRVPELQIIGQLLPITLELVVTGLIFAVIIGLFTGSVAAANRNNPVDYTVKGIYLLTWGAPVFLVAFILQLFLAYDLRLLPANGIAEPTLAIPPPVTGKPYISVLPQPVQGALSGLIGALTSPPLIRAAVEGDWPFFMSAIHHLVLPALTIAITSFGVVTRLTRASMIDALDRDYVKLSFMKGFTKNRVVYGTAFRNAIIPIITLIALLFGFSTAGAVVVEDIFQYRGMGWFTVQAIYNLDYIAILATTVIVGISVIVANLVADLLYGWADPRVRLE